MTVPSEPVSDTKLDTAALAVISFKGLLEKDEDEILKLFKAAVSPGFFYVDVRDSEQHVADIQEMATICARYFKQPEVVKMRDFVKGHEFSGYKAVEGWNAFGILHDDLENNRVPYPETLQPDAITIQRFGSYCHHIAKTMVTHLSEPLWPKSSIRLEDKHRPTKTSNSTLSFYRGPEPDNMAEFGDGTHTDGGTLTLLYCDQLATQVELPWNNKWAWVEPKPGHAIVNVGDSLQALSGGRIHSPRHRVSLPAERYEEVLYFLRPEHGTTLTAL